MSEPSPRTLAVLWLAAWLCSCGRFEVAAPEVRQPHSHAGTPRTPPAAEVDPARRRLREAIDAAAGYLVRACGHDGRFVYRVHVDDPTYSLGGYNILRHAGAMYALAEHHRRWPRPDSAAALGRASRHLRAHVAPGDGWSAVFSTPRHEEAKLGATGLALVAWTRMGGPVDVAELRRLGGFLRYMQRPSGRLVSKYFASRGPDDSWTSLYYPGEAALGATLLSELDPGAGWDSLAERALMYLHRQRHGAARVPLDHWALLATRALHRRGSLREELRAHGRQICRSMLLANASPPPGHALHGCFTGDGRTTPTATRLEGLIAALSFVDDPALAARIRREVDAGIAFLLRAQQRGGRLDGAVPHALLSEDASDEAGEVRIDYVQHALSAWMDYLALSDEQTGQIGEVEADQRNGDPQQAP